MVEPSVDCNGIDKFAYRQGLQVFDLRHMVDCTTTPKMLFQVTGAFSEVRASMIRQRLNAGA